MTIIYIYLTGDQHHLYCGAATKHKGSQGNHDLSFRLKFFFHSVQTGFKLPESLIKSTGKFPGSNAQFSHSLTCRRFNVESTSIDGEKDDPSSKQE